MRRIALAAVFALTALPATAARLPACAGPAEISGAVLLRVEINGVVVVTDGRALVLEGIRLPLGPPDHAPASYGSKALAEAVALTRKGPLTISSVPPKEDRYGRVRGQLVTADGTWVQQVLLRKGLARVSISPDRTDCASELYAAEAQGRAAHAGIWADRAYAIRDPNGLGHDVGTFQVVEGRVLNAEKKNGRAYLNFGADWHSDFTVTIEPEDMANFRAAGVDPMSYQGQTIRVRGLVQWLNGPEIEVANPQGIEVVP